MSPQPYQVYDPMPAIGNALKIQEMRRQNQLTETQQDYTNKQARQKRALELAQELLPKIKGEKTLAVAKQIFLGAFPEFTEIFPANYQALMKLYEEMPEAKGYAPGTEIGRITGEGWESIHKVEAKPAGKRQIGDTRVFRKGTKRITQEWTRTGWRELGVGEAFAPKGVGEKLPKEMTEKEARDLHRKIISSIFTEAGFMEFAKQPTPAYRTLMKQANDIADKMGWSKSIVIHVPTGEGDETTRQLVPLPQDEDVEPEDIFFTVEEWNKTHPDDQITPYDVLKRRGWIR